LVPVGVSVGVQQGFGYSPTTGLPGALLATCSSAGPFLTAARSGEAMVWSPVASDRFQVSLLVPFWS
jgi:hypothetical protein